MFLGLGGVYSTFASQKTSSFATTTRTLPALQRKGHLRRVSEITIMQRLSEPRNWEDWNFSMGLDYDMTFPAQCSAFARSHRKT